MNDEETLRLIYEKVFELHLEQTFIPTAEITSLLNPFKFLHRYVMDFKVKNRCIYNYTSWKGFNVICKSNQFQIGHLKYMNDKNEFNHTKDICVSVLKKISATEKEIYVFISKWQNLPFQDAYIWSFSLNPDNQSLWGFYNGGTEDKGIAMGYDGQDIMKALNNHFNPSLTTTDQISFGNSYIFCLRVVYDQKFKEHVITILVNEWLIDYRTAVMGVDDAKKMLLNIIKVIFFCGLIFKNKRLYGEEEIRYVILKKNSDNMIHPEGIREDKPYVICPLHKINMLKKVILQKNSPHTFSEVESILTKYNFKNVSISESELPY
jgi:hypothetical protein